MSRSCVTQQCCIADAVEASASTAGVFFELVERLGQVDHDTAATPGTLVALITGEHLEIAAIDEEPDLDEIVAAVVTLLCVRMAHTAGSALTARR